jgi:hypothetical protein
MTSSKNLQQKISLGLTTEDKAFFKINMEHIFGEARYICKNNLSF